MRIWLSLLLLSMHVGQSDRREGLDSPFEMGVSERVTIPGHLTLEFREVTRDSRCPKGVQCIRAGEAVVEFDVTIDGAEPLVLAFEVPPGNGTSERVGDLEVSIVELRPEAVEGRAIANDAYRATVSVSPSPD